MAEEWETIHGEPKTEYSWDGTKIIYARDFGGATTLRAEVGTTGPRGGDGGHGGNTTVRLVNVNGTDWRILTSGPDADRSVQIIVRGDDEMRNLAAALRFAADVLETEGRPRLPGDA